ncbi:MAG: YkgJ family cysteine cluster protein [Thermodesulfobacteriota bacterium]
MPLDAYQRLLSSLAGQLVRLERLAANAAHLRCGPGCASCCRPFSVLPIEAAALANALTALPPATRERIHHQARAATESCPLLIDGLCTLYQARPVICRTHGLPLAYLNEELEAIEVSACPMNFTDEYEFSPEQLLFMDEVNAELRQANQAYCGRHGLPPDRRIPIQLLAAGGWLAPTAD